MCLSGATERQRSGPTTHVGYSLPPTAVGLAETVVTGVSGPANSPYLKPFGSEVADVSHAEPGSTHNIDADLRPACRVRETRPRQWDVVVAVAVGGVIGTEARYGIELAVPHRPSGFPWSILIINATGSLAIGALMVLLVELTLPHRLARPFLGVGVLGGYTTYSTFAVDTVHLLNAHRPAAALAYMVLTVVVCLIAVAVASTTTKAAGEAIIAARIRKARHGRRRS